MGNPGRLEDGCSEHLDWALIRSSERPLADGFMFFTYPVVFLGHGAGSGSSAYLLFWLALLGKSSYSTAVLSWTQFRKHRR